MKKKFRDFESAREFAIELRLKDVKMWYAYCKLKKPIDIPYNPERTYKNKGWISWGDFLGTGNTSSHKIQFRDFKSSREFARSLGLKSKHEWDDYCKSDHKPEDIPTTPYRIYKNKGWVSMGDWLGTGRVADQLKEYRDFKSSREFVRGLKFRNEKMWKDYCKSGDKPDDIPSHPQGTYKNKGWIGMGDWLGTGRVANFNKQFRDFKSAREFVRGLKLSGEKEWNDFKKSGKRPKDIPALPHKTYKDNGWISYGDWYGTGRVADQLKEYRDFKSAREFARKLKLKGSKEWYGYCKSGNKPDDIPALPSNTYKNKGWASWGDWLGTGNISNVSKSKQYLPFKDAREEARKLAKQYNIKNWNDWKNAVKRGLIPKNIPANPNRSYTKSRKKKRE